ncbi:ricin-type beta-trefoil lectin domain protein [Actinoplanes sp. NPDC026623]|uniref:RICIN domain-containing protein n=1 Tax=Actinoplanes sp. NPDC026623 TaxID=3155610 RepID=UPI00340B06E3
MRLRFRTRRETAGDEGSMPMALLVTMIAMGMTATLVPVVVSQVTSTRIVDARTVSLDAAQAGLDVALGQVRAAALPPSAPGGIPTGVLEELPPCTITGSQDSGGLQDTETAPATLRYRVGIVYYGLPSGSTPTPLSCPPTVIPKTAVLTSTGTDSPTAALTLGSPRTRTIEATYTFKTTNANITGGAIQLAAPTNPSRFCMDADSTPAAGEPVNMSNCTAGVPRDQRFAYTQDINIRLVGSETSGAPGGLCLDAPTPHVANQPVKFQPCQVPIARSQQWSLGDDSNFHSTSSSGVLEGMCLNLQVAGVAGPLVIGGCGNTNDKQVFRPRAEVGAGMASAATGQLVNYKQFSRCLDVTDHDVGKAYMIAWYCKQAPDPSAVSWNQKWSLPPISHTVAGAVRGAIRSGHAGSPIYCLRTPDTLAGFVTLATCNPTDPPGGPKMEWIRYGDTGDPVTSYRIVDTNGNCLQPSDLDAPNPEVHPADGTAKIKVAACSASELQKWNAPADYNKPLVLSNTTEK